MRRYSGLQRLLHWLVAIIVVCLLSTGLLIWFLGFDGVTSLLGESQRNQMYKYHKTFGLIVLVLMAFRLFVRLEAGKPRYDYPLAIGEIWLSAIVHYLFYVALIAQPILGWLATDALDYPVEFFEWTLPQFIAKDKAMGETLYQFHGYVGWALVGLLVLHVAGAVKHWMIDQNGVMGRMRPF